MSFLIISGLIYNPIDKVINKLVEDGELSLDKLTSEFPDFKVETFIWDKLSEQAKEKLLLLGFRKD